MGICCFDDSEIAGVVAQVVPHSLATHHHVIRGPRSSERHEPGTEPSPVSSYWGSDVSPEYMPTRSEVSGNMLF